ncbi:MAG: UDP-N-acetylglucosamine 2-epimerase (non-hydrolyzing) [Gammaproteobacteria bacterium]
MKILTVFGTRPEAIKMAPVVLGMQRDSAFKTVLCVTAQHREMLDQVLDVFSIQPDFDLDLMIPGQSLYDLIDSILRGAGAVIRETRPDLVLVHGDTSTCFAAALAAFYEKTPIGHVEAGLRSGDLYAPFPEEANRSLVARIAALHFAPTASARANLINENIAENKIVVTGNTVIDALFLARDKVAQVPEREWMARLGSGVYQRVVSTKGRLILITGHRRENFGQGFMDLCSAIKYLAQTHPDWEFVYPVHLNPNVQKPVHQILGGIENISLMEPLEYLPFVWLMNNCDLILTDSGGIQEEGPSLGKPVLVMREKTERPEALVAGTVKLVGTNRESIISNVEDVLLNNNIYETMSKAENPYGDGNAVARILEFIKQQFLQ